MIGSESLEAVSVQDKATMLANLTTDLNWQCTRIIFIDDDRENFPHGRGWGDVQPRDTWALVNEADEVVSPQITLIAYPVGEGEGGTGLDATAMREITSLVVGLTG